jgi:hypothetical protein
MVVPHLGAFHVYSMASGGLIGSVYGRDTAALGSSLVAFREDEGVTLIAVASMELLRYRIAAQ